MPFVSTQNVNSGSTFTAGIGSDRIIVIAVTHENGTARYLTGVTWNGNAVGAALLNAAEAATGRGITSWILKESDITGNDAGTLSLSYNTTPTNIRTTQTTFADMAQSYTPSDYDITAGSTGATTLTRTVTIPSGGSALGIVVTNWDAGADFTWTNATESFDGNNSGSSTARTGVAYNESSGSQGLQASWTDSVGCAMLAVALSAVSGASIAPLANYYRMLRNA